MDTPPENHSPAPRPAWRDVWQVPALVAAVALLTTGVVTAVLTAPAPDVTDGIGEASKMVEGREYAEALELLNKRVLPSLNKSGLAPEARRKFHLLRAQALYLGQKELDLDRPENNANIREEYAQAEKHNATLGDRDQYFLAHTLVSLGDLGAATNRVELLGPTHREWRVELLKRIVNTAMATRPPDTGRALDVVTLLSADPTLSADERCWALTRQGELLITTGYAGEAITKIVRTLPRIEGASPEAEGEVLVTLAKAYLAEDATPEAGRNLARALDKLGGEHPLVPLVTLLQAEISHHDGDLAQARAQYAKVVDEYSFSDGRPAALLGLGEVEAQLNRTQGSGPPEESIERYTQLVEMLRSEEEARRGPSGHPKQLRERVAESLLSRFREQYEKKEYETALRYADLGEKLFAGADMPAELMFGLAEVHTRLAEHLLADAAGEGALSLADADPATQREAKKHLLRAGDMYRLHGTRVVAGDATGAAQSLWLAADALDRAGDLDGSVQAFQQFVTEFPGDLRRPEGTFRLAQAYRARGDLELAGTLYQALIDERGVAEGAGVWADQSYVPLARTLLGDTDKENDARGEQILIQVVSGEVTGPGTAVFREAVGELGELMQRTGRFAPAIERFEQYLTLSDQANAGPETAVRFRLAEAYRRSAAEIAKTLETGVPEGEKRRLEHERTDRLTKAAALYERVAADYDAKPRRTALEELTRRNAAFYLGDCAFDLGDYDAAIRHYDAARERYAKDPATLVAMIQIVNAYIAKGETARAAAANERAKRFFASLPEAAWDDPTLPMARADWEGWLDAQDALTKTAAAKTE